MIITAITKRKRQARYDVYLDGRYYVTLSEDAVLTHRLRVGQEVEAASFAETMRDAERQDAVAYVLSALSTRAHTTRTATDKLREKGFSADAIDYAIAKMKYYGYIDDEAYCEDYIAETHASRSNRRIRQDLREKGIPDAVIAAHLADNDEHDACYLSLSRRARGKEMTPEFVAKLKRYLLQQGYEYDTVSDCLHRYAEEYDD